MSVTVTIKNNEINKGDNSKANKIEKILIKFKNFRKLSNTKISSKTKSIK